MAEKVKRPPKRLGDIPSYLDNPSVGAGLTKWVLPKSKIENADRADWQNRDTGEVTHMEKVGSGGQRNYLVDTKQFIKFFTESSWDVRNLNSSAIKVLMFIFEILEKEHDVVVLEYERANRYYELQGDDFGCSDDSFRNGIYDLLKAKLIFRKVGYNNEYFVNVNKFFIGQRTNLQAFKDLNEKLRKGEYLDGFDAEGHKRLEDAEAEKKRYARMNAGIKELKRK